MLQEHHGLKVAQDGWGEGRFPCRSGEELVPLHCGSQPWLWGRMPWLWAVWVQGGCWQCWLVTLGVPLWACTGMMMQMLFFLFPPQLSGADPECSCDEGDETSRKKRSRNL